MGKNFKANLVKPVNPRKLRKRYPAATVMGWTEVDRGSFRPRDNTVVLVVRKMRLHPTKGWRAVRPGPERYRVPVTGIKWENLGQVMYG